jgi:hypothetical protein
MFVNLNILERDSLNFSKRVYHDKQSGGSLVGSFMKGLSKLTSQAGKKVVDKLTSESTKKFIKDSASKALDSAVAEAGPAIGKYVGKRATQVLNKVESKMPVQFQEQVRPVIEQTRQVVAPEVVDAEVQKLAKKFRAMKGMGGSARNQPVRKIVDFL